MESPEDGCIYLKKKAVEKEACKSDGRLLEYLLADFNPQWLPKAGYEVTNSRWHVQFFSKYLNLVLQPWQEKHNNYFKPKMFIFEPNFLTEVVKDSLFGTLNDTLPCPEKMFLYDFWVFPENLVGDQWAFTVLCYPDNPKRAVVFALTSTESESALTEKERSLLFEYSKTVLIWMRDELNAQKQRKTENWMCFVEIIQVPFIPKQKRKSDCLFFLFYFLKVLSCSRLFETCYKEEKEDRLWPRDLYPHIDTERRIFSLVLNDLLLNNKLDTLSTQELLPNPPAELLQQLEHFFNIVEDHNHKLTQARLVAPHFVFVTAKDETYSGVTEGLSNNTELPPKKRTR